MVPTAQRAVQLKTNLTLQLKFTGTKTNMALNSAILKERLILTIVSVSDEGKVGCLKLVGVKDDKRLMLP